MSYLFLFKEVCMLKIIHCSDLHLDSKMESNLSPEKARERREELLSTFSRMVDYAVSNDVSIIMIAGDMFDRSLIRKSAKKRVIDEIKTHSMIDFIYLRGNHDNVDFLSDVEEDDIPKNFKQFNKDEWISYDYRVGDKKLTITGRELTDDNSNHISTNLVLDSANINIVMLHGQEREGNIKIRDNETIRLNDFKNKNIDYLALGHIHSYRKDNLDERGVYAYSGCLEGRGFDECNEKGFILLNVSSDKIESKFIPFAYRLLHTIEIEIDKDMSKKDIISCMEDKVRDISSRDLIKFVLTGKTSLDITSVTIDNIKSQFEEKFYFVKVYDRTRIYIDYENYKYDKTLKGEFVRLLQNEDLKEEDRDEIVEIGIKAILGEDIS